MKFVKFTCLSKKARNAWIQEQLIRLGYLQPCDSNLCKKNEKLIKALRKFQIDNNLTPNAEVHEQEYNLLNAKEAKQ